MFTSFSRRSTLHLAAVSAFAVLSAPVARAQRIVDTLQATFDTLRKPVPIDLGPGVAKVEVREFFGYWCPHCANLEPSVREWKAKLPKTIQFVRTPVAFDKRQIPLVQLYYTLETFPNAAELHQSVFDAIHRVRNLYADSNKASLQTFAERVLKLDREAFNKAWDSPRVVAQTKAAPGLVEQFDVDSVPVFVVHGRFSTSLARMARSPQGKNAKVDQLVQDMFQSIERAAHTLGA